MLFQDFKSLDFWSWAILTLGLSHNIPGPGNDIHIPNFHSIFIPGSGHSAKTNEASGEFPGENFQGKFWYDHSIKSFFHSREWLNTKISIKKQI